MEDFGDYMGQQLQQFASRVISQVVTEVNMRRRMTGGQKIVADANRNAAVFKDAVDNGKNAVYDFTDGIANTVTFDLSPYEIGDDPEANKALALDNLKKCLEENGFNPEELVAVHPEGGTSPHEFIFTFADADANKMEKVMFSWTNKVCETGGLAEKLGIQERHYQVCGFGELDQGKRKAFYEALARNFEANGVDPGEIALSLNQDETLAGDISVSVDRKWLLDKACDDFSKEFGKRLLPMYSFEAANAIPSYDEMYANSVSLSRSLLQKGVDGKMMVLQNGSALIEVDPGGVPKLANMIEAYNSEVAEIAYRKSQYGAGILNRADKGMPSIKDLVKHARMAEEALKEDAAARGAEKLQEGASKTAERAITPPVI